jgi:hypothetical protein
LVCFRSCHFCQSISFPIGWSKSLGIVIANNPCAFDLVWKFNPPFLDNWCRFKPGDRMFYNQLFWTNRVPFRPGWLFVIDIYTDSLSVNQD